MTHTNRGYWILCLLLLPVVILLSFSRTWTISADHWETAAAIRAASEDVLHPSNPMLPLPGHTSPRFTPYTVFWGALMRLTGLHLFVIIALAGIVNFLLFVTGLGRFVQGQFRDSAMPAYALFTMLFVWGTGYSEANAYQLAMFLQTLPLVAIFAYGLFFHALASLRAYIDEFRGRSLVLYVLFATTAFVSHPITGAFGFVAAAAILLDEGDWKRTILLQLVPLFTLGITLLWPYFDYFAVLTKGSATVWYKNPIFSGQVEALGTALAGLPILLYYGLHKRYLFLVYGFLFCGSIYALSKFTNVQIGSRFILYAAIFLHLAIARYLQEHRLLQWQGWRNLLQNGGVAFVFVVLLLLSALWYRAREMKWILNGFYDPPFSVHLYQEAAQPYFFLSNYLDGSAVVMAGDTTGWVIPAITGAKLVSQLKGNPLISTEIERRWAVVDSFFESAMTLEARRRALVEYQASHILLDLRKTHRWDSSFFRDLPALARKEAEQGILALYRVEEP